MHTLPAIMVAAGSGGSGFSSAWNNFYNSVNSAFPNLFKWMAIAGICLVVFGVGKYALDKRRGGANSQNLLWSIIAGGLLASPAVLIPVVLKAADSVINVIKNVFGG